jgi:hypothetical protein
MIFRDHVDGFEQLLRLAVLFFQLLTRGDISG